MNRFAPLVLVSVVSLGVLQGCFSLLGVGAGAAGKNIHPKPPKAETADNCQSWECWDGYACGPCEEGATPDQASKSK